MRPQTWAHNPDPPELPSLWCLENAWVVGGDIRGRERERHWDGQLVLTSSGGLLPGSFGVMDGNRTLPRDLLVERPEATGTFSTRLPSKSRRLPGTYVLLGNVHRHFGHVVLEGLTRSWAWHYLSEDLLTEAKFLIYETEVRPFARELLELASIPAERVVSASPLDSVERLVVPDVAMRTHHWVTTLQGSVWRHMAASVEPPSRTDRRVFLSRTAVDNRPLRNAAAVEELFVRCGWEVQRPEDLTVRDQVRLAQSCSSLAGEVGSQMYLACFQRPGARNIIVAPSNFFLADDVLVASTLDHELDVVFGGAVDFTRPKPERGWECDLQAVERLLAGEASAASLTSPQKRTNDMRYIDLLSGIHQTLQPSTYLEIGVHEGRSLALSRTTSIGIDPAFAVKEELRCDVSLFRTTSDEYFAQDEPLAPFGGNTIQFAFIDGMHLFEYALRDFMSVERNADWSSVIVFDDMLPRSSQEAARNRETSNWTGDVYKLIAVLDRYRPDLIVLQLNTSPTGLLLVLGADRENTVLQENYDRIVAEFATPDPQDVPQAILERSDAIDARQFLRSPVLPALRDANAHGHVRDTTLSGIRKAADRLRPGPARG